MNASTEIRCIDNLDPQALLDPSPDDATELEELVDAARDYAAECAKRNDTTLPYLSTDAVVQDLDVIRQAVGDEKLSYLGFSYGTLIGSLYADRFPDRVRAMVLDGAMDPSIELEQFRAGQAAGFEKALTSFLDDCAARTACAFHEGGKTAAAFDALMASIDAKPLPATLAHDRRSVGPGIAEYAVLAALYSQESWPVLASSLALAKRGDGSLLLAIADPYQGRKPNGSYSNQHDAYTANTCLDFTAPTDVATYTDWAKKLEASAPHFAELIAYNDLACAFWPVAARADARDGLGRRCSADRGRRHDRRSGDALRLGAGPGQGADVGGPGHPRRRRPHGIPHRLVRAAGGQRVPARTHGAEGRVDLPVGRRLAQGDLVGLRRRRSARPGRPDRRSPGRPRRR